MHGIGDRLAWFLHAAALAKLQQRKLVTTWPVAENTSLPRLLRHLRFPPELSFVSLDALPADADYPGREQKRAARLQPLPLPLPLPSL